MAQIESCRYVGLDAVGVIDLVFGHLSLYDLNRSFRFRQTTGRFSFVVVGAVDMAISGVEKVVVL